MKLYSNCTFKVWGLLQVHIQYYQVDALWNLNMYEWDLRAQVERNWSKYFCDAFFELDNAIHFHSMQHEYYLKHLFLCYRDFFSFDHYSFQCQWSDRSHRYKSESAFAYEGWALDIYCNQACISLPATLPRGVNRCVPFTVAHRITHTNVMAPQDAW